MQKFTITAEDLMKAFTGQVLLSIRTKEEVKENCYFDIEYNKWRMRYESSVWGSFHYAKRLGSLVMCDSGNITLSFVVNDRMQKFIDGHVKNIMDSINDDWKLEAKK